MSFRYLEAASERVHPSTIPPRSGGINPLDEFPQSAYNKGMDIPVAVLSSFAGLLGGTAAWFTFARRLTTREEVDKMIQDRARPLEERQARVEDLLDGLRDAIGALRGEIIRLTVTLEQQNRRPPD